ncbi:MAG: hypothetical protein FWB72_05480 [Firmicutes bacterium]|nr:hypothetical protein [Bacillota bacterium]
MILNKINALSLLCTKQTARLLVFILVASFLITTVVVPVLQRPREEAAAAVTTQNGSANNREPRGSNHNYIAADWIFDRENSIGELSDNTLSIQDLSGHDNHLELRAYGTAGTAFNADEQFQFDTTSMTNNNGSLRFGGEFAGGRQGINTNTNLDPNPVFTYALEQGLWQHNNAPRNGFSFVTVADAPINTNNFRNGFTMEFLYRMPADFSGATDNGMGILTRSSNMRPDGRFINEYAYNSAQVDHWTSTHPNHNQQLHSRDWGNSHGNTVFVGSGRYSGWNSIRHSPLSLHVTNVREPEFHLFSEAGTEMSNAHWGLAMDIADAWFNIVIKVCFDTDYITSYVNHGPSFRNRNMNQWTGVNAGRGGENFTGLFTDLNDPRLEIGVGLRAMGEPAFIDAVQGLALRDERGALLPRQFLRGSLERVRISETVLDYDQWIIADAPAPLGCNRDWQLTNPDNYTMMFIPDTQNTIRFAPDVSHRATDYLIRNRDRFNMVHISHLGDIVQDNTDLEWANAQQAFWPLAYHFNYLSMRGNHDGNPVRHNRFFGPYAHLYAGGTHAATNGNSLVRADSLTRQQWSEQGFNQHAQKFRNNTYYDLVRGRTNYRRDADGAFVPNSDSSYMIVRGGSYNYLIITMGYVNQGGNQGTAELAWLDEILSRYPTKPAIITSHHIFTFGPGGPDHAVLSGPGTSIWNVARQHDNVFLIVGAHNHTSGRTNPGYLVNDAGNEVFGMLVNFQFGFNGGNAWYRFLEFDEAGGFIDYTTFSPYVASLSAEERARNTTFNVNFLEGRGTYGRIYINFAERFAFATEYDDIVVTIKQQISELFIQSRRSVDTGRNSLDANSARLISAIRYAYDNVLTDTQRAQIFNIAVLEQVESIQGNVGATGGWITGTGSPDEYLGQLMDLFLDIQSGNIYRKTLTGWQLVANLVGEQGETGATGGQGAPGAQGSPGTAGAQGTPGVQGAPGEDAGVTLVTAVSIVAIALSLVAIGLAIFILTRRRSIG